MSRKRLRSFTSPIPAGACIALAALLASACAMEEPSEADLEVDGLPAALAGNTWAMKTSDGHFVTAVNAGGRTVEAVHTDATSIGDWETFVVENPREGDNFYFAFRTSRGFYLTAEGGGGRTVDAIATNRTSSGPWERFKYLRVGIGGSGRYFYKLATADGVHWLTARNGGNQVVNALETNRTDPRTWETFEFIRVD